MHRTIWRPSPRKSSSTRQRTSSRSSLLYSRPTAPNGYDQGRAKATGVGSSTRATMMDPVILSTRIPGSVLSHPRRKRGRGQTLLLATKVRTRRTLGLGSLRTAGLPRSCSQTVLTRTPRKRPKVVSRQKRPTRQSLHVSHLILSRN